MFTSQTCRQACGTHNRPPQWCLCSSSHQQPDISEIKCYINFMFPMNANFQNKFYTPCVATYMRTQFPQNESSPSPPTVLPALTVTFPGGSFGSRDGSSISFSMRSTIVLKAAWSRRGNSLNQWERRRSSTLIPNSLRALPNSAGWMQSCPTSLYILNLRTQLSLSLVDRPLDLPHIFCRS